MAKNLKAYINLAKGLAELFSPMLEVSLFEKNKLLYVFNRLTHEKVPPIEENKPSMILINKSQQAKAMIIPLENNYCLRFIVETSVFESIQDLLHKFLVRQQKTDETTNWQQLVDNSIADYLQHSQVSLSALTMAEKRNLVLQLQEKDLLKYQDATKYLANKLGVSRATVYNYLNHANQLKSLEIHQVDAFTSEPFSGNPAGVVLDADGLNEITMKKIAREMNLSETSFLLNSDKADLKLRYFTPNGSEVKFCGHSTVGALYMLAHKKMLGMKKPGHYPLNLEAQVGIIPAAITLKSDETITVQFQAPATKLVEVDWDHEELAAFLDIPVTSINTQKSILFDNIQQDLFITVTSLEELKNLSINLDRAKRFAEKHDIVAYAFLCNQTISKKSHIHMRCFAPLVGIPEDPFTGSVLGGLATYALKNKLVPRSTKTIRVEQGHFIQRPGYVDLILNATNDFASPLVVAKARHFFSTKINL